MAQDLTTRQQAFLDALFGEAKGNARQAAILAGYPDNANLSQLVKPLRETILDMADTQLAMSAAAASMVLTDQLFEPDPMGKEKMIAANSVLDRVGMSKHEREASAKGKRNYVFLIPAKRIDSVDVTALEFEEAVPNTVDTDYEDSEDTTND